MKSLALRIGKIMVVRSVLGVTFSSLQLELQHEGVWIAQSHLRGCLVDSALLDDPWKQFSCAITRICNKS